MLIFAVVLTSSAESFSAAASSIAPAAPENSIKTVYDLIVLVVDKELQDDGNSYVGLSDQFGGEINEESLNSRIERYADDLVDNNKLTNVKTIYFDKEKETVRDISDALENLYINGSGSGDDRLVGVVLIGEIPLPVVNKNGNSYVSVFPYTDFSEKAYLYNPKTSSFERNQDINFPKPEIWHGLIKAPENSSNSGEQLAYFFDKNHLYYKGVDMFARFDRKLFFGDLFHEEEQMSGDVYSHYLKYLKALEDLVYLRYNKFWASELTQSVVADLPFNLDNPINKASGDNPGFAASVKSGDSLANLPDIYAKTIIDQALIPYYRLFGKFIGKVNDWALYTGRYQSSDVDSIPGLITMKDEFSKYYLKSVNDALEKKINEVVSIIEEPLPVLEYSVVSGEFTLRDANGNKTGTEGFEIDISNPASPITADDETFHYRFHYLNEVNDKLYVNGIDALTMNSAKQCLPYLGSTRTDYFDRQTLDYNPKAAGGKYSILTRALRSDNLATAQAVHTTGINTRLLSSGEISALTNGAYGGVKNTQGFYETGAVIEDNPDYGISAFMDNPIPGSTTQYKNPLEGKFQKGDIIVNVNGQNISYAHGFDQAVEDAYMRVSELIDGINDGDVTKINNALHLESEDPANDFSNFQFGLATPDELIVNMDQFLNSDDFLDNGPVQRALFAAGTRKLAMDAEVDTDESVAGIVSVDFYRNGQLNTEIFTFSVTTDDDAPSLKYTSKEDPDADPEMAVVFSRLGLPQGFDFDDDSDGAIFTLYNNKDAGYESDTRAYDQSAGCNARSAIKNSDRCIAKVATMPVLDAAGSEGLVKFEVPAFGTFLKFPENVKKNDAGENSGNPIDYARHVEQFQFPGGGSGDFYKYEDVDEVYYDACYSGLPAVEDGLTDDSNPYGFVLDGGSSGGGLFDDDINIDFYGRLLDAIGEFVDDDLADEADYGDEEDVGTEFNASQEIWLGFNNLQADQIVVNDDGELVTLNSFAKRYGLIDGLDNDNDGLKDFEWRDQNSDGVYETKWYDFDEADERYGLPASNVNLIARKLLSKTATYTIPYGTAGFPYNDYNQDIVLKVQANPYQGKQISSMIVHNEPTNHTISEQIKAKTTFSLPIDNPRYVAFQGLPDKAPVYPQPQPVNSNIDVQAILAGLDTTTPSYAGKTYKIVYPNLFDSQIANLAQLQAKLTALADQMATVNGSYKIMGPTAKAGDFTLAEISREILNNHLNPVIAGATDLPSTGFDLDVAQTSKLFDALNWKSRNIDQKHEYILKYYLNASGNTNAYINDATLFPPGVGEKAAYGYEAAYLVLDGEDDYFDLAFNKDLPEESDARFGPLATRTVGASGDDLSGAEDAGNNGGGDFEFVWLAEFLEEVSSFISYFTSVPDFQQACGFLANTEEFIDRNSRLGAIDNVAVNNQPLSSLEIASDKEIFNAREGDKLTITVKGLDTRKNLLGSGGNGEVVNLKISDNSILESADGNIKTLNEGTAAFSLSATGKDGSVTVSVESDSGIKSSALQLRVLNTDVKLYTYTYLEIEGAQELLEKVILEAVREGAFGDVGEGADVPKELEAENSGEPKSLGIEGVQSDNEEPGSENPDGAESGGEVSSENSEGANKNSNFLASGKADSGDSDGRSVSGDFISELEKVLSGGTQTRSNIAKDQAGGESSSDGTVGGANVDTTDLNNGNSSSDGGGESDKDPKASPSATDKSGSGQKNNSVNNAKDSAGNVEEGNKKGDNLKVLASKPVKEVTLKSDLVEDPEDSNEDVANSEAGGGDESSDTGDTDDGEKTTVGVEVKWEEYFVLKKYYEKFISGRSSSSLKRYSVELYSDRLMALLPDDQNPFIDAVKNPESKYVVNTNDSFVADGKSLMKVEAQVFDKNGKLELDQKTVKFFIENVDVPVSNDKIAVFENGDKVTSDNAVAKAYLRAGTKTGKFKLIAEVLDASGNVDKNYPRAAKEIFLVAGAPTAIEIQSDSSVLVANNQSKTTVKIILKDRFGNLANNAFTQVALFVNNTAQLDEKADINKNIIGTQLSTFEGIARIDLFSKEQAGKANLIAVLFDYELENLFIDAENDLKRIDFENHVGASKSFEILDKVNLEFTITDADFNPTTTSLADGQSIIRMGVKLIDAKGQTVDGYSDKINFRILNENLGRFITAMPKKMDKGLINTADIGFKANKQSGKAEVNVDIPGFVSEVLSFELLAGDPAKIELLSSDASIFSDEQNEVTLQARILDKNNNLVSNNIGTQVQFAATQATKELITFSPSIALSVNGIATTTVLGAQMSGQANITAVSEGLEDGTVALKVKKHISVDKVKDFSPRALYVSLLGGAFGKPGIENLAQAMIFSGQTQAVSSLTSSTTEKKRLVGVDGYGKVAVLSSTVETKVTPGVELFPYQKITVSDNVLSKDLAKIFLVPKPDTPLVLLGKEAAADEGGDQTEDIEVVTLPEEEGIYVQQLSKADKDIKFLEKADGIYIEKGNETKVKIDKTGRITISDEGYSLKLPEKDIETNEYSLLLLKRGAQLGLISFKQDFGRDVERLEYDQQKAGYAPGIYIQKNTNSSQFGLISSFTRYSTLEPRGSYLVDLEKEIDADQAPGFGYSTLEEAKDKFGIGFENDNKHMLFFTAGNSVGESSLPYASEIGIIYGDPTIRLKVEIDENNDGKYDLISEASGYGKDIGKPIFSGKEPIKKLIDFDFNADGYDDVLLVYESGLIRLLQNEVSNRRYNDRGYILNLYGEILSLEKIDLNNDGFDDLVAGTKDSCKVGEECISALVNNKGNFVRETLNLALNNKKAYEIKAGDMNADGCEDLVVSDSSGEINIFYNQNDGDSCTGLETNSGYKKSFGFSIDNQAALAKEIFLSYPGMENPDEGEAGYLQGDGQDNDGDGVVDEKSNLYKFIQFSLPSDLAPIAADEGAGFVAQANTLQSNLKNSSHIASSDVPAQSYEREFDFIHLPEDSTFGNAASKQAIDVNGGTVALGDLINYVITINNPTNRNINKIYLSDSTPASLKLLPETLKCLDLNCNDDLQWLDSGLSLRSKVISGVSLPAQGTRTISYSMKVEQMPKVNFDVGNDFANYPSSNGDSYLDILIRPELNPDKILTYIYSTGLDDQGKVVYRDFEVNAQGEPLKNVIEKGFKESGLPDANVLFQHDPTQGVSPKLAREVNKLSAKQSYDADYNGCSDSWGGLLESYESGAEAIASGIEGALGALRCSGGGCIPFNYAFLAPDYAIPGLALLAFYPALPPVLPLQPSLGPSVARIYLNPTLSMGLATAVCAGPGSGHLSPCFAFAVPGGIPGVCSFIQGAIEGIVSTIKNAVVDTFSGMSAVISDGTDGATTDDFGLEGNYASDDNPFNFAASVNVKIPGFPSVITNWFDKQIDEIYNKLLDFPSFYFILPDVGPFIAENINAASSLGEDSTWQSFNDFVTAINSIPLIQIEGKEILIRIPALSPKEIEKYKEQGRLWLIHMDEELEKIKSWNCDETPNKKNICDKLTVNVTGLVSSIRKLFNLVDQISNLPRQILDWRHLEAKYATQIICYLDAIMFFTGGYIKRQYRIIESWMKAIEEAIKIFKTWQAILDLIIDYQVSCDRCKNDRFSKLGLLLQIFIVIPEPPIIPLPKWPDLVVDLSQIKTGVHILWPDVVFKPQPIKLPDLPVINLPDIIPDIAIDIPGFEVPDFPEFILPNLPDLPPLPLPKLPDIPRPPKIPALPDLVVDLLALIKPILKILCLLKNGLLPVPEAALATEIETLTQPGIQIVLPIIAALGVQWPPIKYDYVKEIRVTGKVNFEIDTSAIYLVAQKGADIWNKNVRKVIEGLNQFLNIPYGEIINSIIQEAVDKAKEAAAKAITDGIKSAGDSIGVDAGSIIKTNVDSALPLALNAQTDQQLNEIIKDTSQALDFEEIALNNPAISGFKNSVNDLDKLIKDFSDDLAKETYPEKYYLTATETFLDSADPILNRTLAQVKNDIQSEELPNDPRVQMLAGLRDELIAYTENLNSGNELLNEIKDYDQFSKVLVEKDQSLKQIAALTMPHSGGGAKETRKFSLLGKAVEEKMLEAAFPKGRLIAAEVNADSSALAQSAGSTATYTQPKGFYIVADGINENVLNYTAELKKPTHVVFNDVDKDNDVDIVFSMGGDVYLKENHKNKLIYPKGKVIKSFTDTTVTDLLPEAGNSVSGVVSDYENNQKADLSWIAKPEAYAYEIVLRKSIDEGIDDAVYRYFVLPKAVESEESREIMKELDIEAPKEGDENSRVILLTNPENPNITLKIPNGFYYANVFALNENGVRSFISDRALLSPQACADKEPPLPAIVNSDFEVPIFGDVQIDASNSFDADGEVVEYYLETLPFKTGLTDPVTGEFLRTTQLPKILWSDIALTSDTDGDGITNNDRNNPRFRVGPFTEEGDVGLHDFLLHVTDQSGNSSAQKITVKVYVPEITLDETFSRSGIATGETKPGTPLFPFSLMRNRYIYRSVNGVLKLVPRIDKVIEGMTDEDGSYSLSNFGKENLILVENAAGEVVAEINPVTGNVGAIKDGYGTEIISAGLPGAPTKIEIKDENGTVLAVVHQIADSNVDVKVLQNYGINAGNHKNLRGVNADDIEPNDQFELKNLPASDSKNPGAAVLVHKGEQLNLTLIDTAGNVLILDQRVTLEQKKNDHITDPFVLELLFKGKKAAEIYIAGENRIGGNAQIVGADSVPFALPKAPSEGILANSNILGKAPFVDLLGLSENFRSLVEDLFQKGIIKGVQTKDGLKLNVKDSVRRKDFVRTFINMLCIIPRPEAYEEFKAGEGYSDVKIDSEYYQYIREGTFLGLVEGYKGELDQSGILPFKPDATISRAEAVKIILEALELKEILDLSQLKVTEGEAWYKPFMTAALDITPYIKAGTIVENNFIITQAEAGDPLKEMTYEELIIMAERVLNFYNCFEIDSDDNGLSNYCEEKYQIKDPVADQDRDGLDNAEECYYGSDPTDVDTDRGGIFDGVEFKLGTNPLDAIDDARDEDKDGLTSKAEILLYKTDPFNPDTDGGGANDGKEVENCTNPLEKNDDPEGNICAESGGGQNGGGGNNDGGEEGIYVVPGECNSCPCPSTLLNKAAIIPADIFFPVISKYYENYYPGIPKEKTYIFSKGNQVTVEAVNK